MATIVSNRSAPKSNAVIPPSNGHDGRNAICIENGQLPVRKCPAIVSQYYDKILGMKISFHFLFHIYSQQNYGRNTGGILSEIFKLGRISPGHNPGMIFSSKFRRYSCEYYSQKILSILPLKFLLYRYLDIPFQHARVYIKNSAININKIKQMSE